VSVRYDKLFAHEQDVLSISDINIIKISYLMNFDDILRSTLIFFYLVGDVN
jgi:hypothetical protein